MTDLERELKRVLMTIAELNKVLGRYKACLSYVTRTKFLAVMFGDISNDLTEIEIRLQNVVDTIQAKINEYNKKKEKLMEEIKKVKMEKMREHEETT